MFAFAEQQHGGEQMKKIKSTWVTEIKLEEGQKGNITNQPIFLLIFSTLWGENILVGLGEKHLGIQFYFQFSLANQNRGSFSIHFSFIPFLPTHFFHPNQTKPQSTIEDVTTFSKVRERGKGDRFNSTYKTGIPGNASQHHRCRSQEKLSDHPMKLQLFSSQVPLHQSWPKQPRA